MEAPQGEYNGTEQKHVDTRRTPDFKASSGHPDPSFNNIDQQAEKGAKDHKHKSVDVKKSQKGQTEKIKPDVAPEQRVFDFKGHGVLKAEIIIPLGPRPIANQIGND